MKKPKKVKKVKGIETIEHFMNRRMKQTSMAKKKKSNT